MSYYNLIAGGVFGLIAVLGGAILSDQVKSHLDAALLEKAVATPAVFAANGDLIREASTQINIIDRRENEAAWLGYVTGNVYIMLNGLAMIGLGMIQTRGSGTRIAIAGGACFTLGILLFGICTCAAAALSMPTLRIPIPVGAIFLAGGWLCLIVASIQAKRQPAAACS
ncbi:DUF423 domain-containing protein [Blastopirellula retiformator]|uniref:DUF423 domain-containing protein n=1 Tax=Blastopirellula retiformator TaxID=2527970 RepID=A0A5C5V207_9BACT|nr:DUF423 domain-containing protein [Blastopirellula retiformator]TWT31742.1 hypothetical protein Enr8_36660 [Blastopirellula retiformator]